MIKILHSADWHLDAPMSGYSAEILRSLQAESRQIPQAVIRLCKEEGCVLLLLAGDLFDGAASAQTVASVQNALAQLDIPVIITPGNHDYCHAGSPYMQEGWPENVHIFKKAQIESIVLPELNCRIYGAGYEAMDCPGLLKRFNMEGSEAYHIGVFHADATTASTYFPITRRQIQESGLDYVALGHIHKQGSLSVGETLCLWPGCPMGRGFDELGPKGVIRVDLGENPEARFVPLDTPRFYDETVNVGDDPAAALAAILPLIDSSDFYRVTLTGYASGIDTAQLAAGFSHIPNLILRDETRPEPDLWQNTDTDTMEGLVFSYLKSTAETSPEPLAQQAALAARICRSILDGQEVVLP